MKDIIGLAVLAWPLVLLFIIGLAFVVAISLAVLYAKRTQRSKWRWGIGAFLLVYLPIFWDWIPTVVMHQYYCAKESGFWVYKTLDQWKAENPGVMEGLVAKKVSIERTGDDDSYIDTQILNQRFRWVTERYRPASFLPIHGRRSEILDSKNDEVIVRHINFSSGEGRGALKFWMNIQGCSNGKENRIALYRFVDTIVNGNSGNNILSGEAGNDTLSSGGGFSYLDGGDGDDLLITDTGGNTLAGGAGDDRLSAGLGGGNFLDGGDGLDVYVFEAGAGENHIAEFGSDNYVQFNFNLNGAGLTVGLGSLKLNFTNGTVVHIDNFEFNDRMLNATNDQWMRKVA